MKSIPNSDSVKAIIDSNLIMAFNQLKVQHIGSLSTDNELVFLNNKEDKIVLNGELKTIAYLYEEKIKGIVVRIID